MKVMNLKRVGDLWRMKGRIRAESLNKAFGEVQNEAGGRVTEMGEISKLSSKVTGTLFLMTTFSLFVFSSV